MSISIAKKIGFTLLAFGTLGILLSIFYESNILTFVCLTLVFWGCLFLLVLPGKYVRSEVMDHISISGLSNIDQVISDSNVQGKPIYIPVPRDSYLPYHIEMKHEFVYIPKRNVKMETAIEQAFMKNPKGLRIIPPGLGFANLIEKKSRQNLYKLDIHSLTKILPSIITQDLEIANKFNMSYDGNVVHTKIGKSLCEDLHKEICKLRNLCPNIGCPLCSSIACILTRITNKPIIIESCSLIKNTVDTTFLISED